LTDPYSALGAGALATFIPLYLGILAPLAIRHASTTARVFAAATASGIVFWFFLDVMNDAALLDINQGFSGNYTHILLASLFGLGVASLVGLEQAYAKKNILQTGDAFPGITFSIAMIAALAVGFHALGEGLAIGSIIPSSTNVVDAIGGLLPAIAYVLHKLLEGGVVGVFALLAGARKVRGILMLGIVGGLPTVLGILVGLSARLESTYFFALGGAGAAYIQFKLIPIYGTSDQKYRAALFVLLGLYVFYIAGLFHG